jgi:hypothetical protein
MGVSASYASYVCADIRTTGQAPRAPVALLVLHLGGKAVKPRGTDRGRHDLNVS